MQPDDGDVFFDHPEEGFSEVQGVERFEGPVPPGTYAVRVQFAVADPALSFQLDDWILVLERVQAP